MRPASLDAARLYLVAPARVGNSSLAEIVPELAAAGVDVIQLREKEMEAGDLLRIGAEVVEVCAAAGVPFVMNDRPDVASILGAGVHVGQNDVPVRHARAIVGDAVVGLSTHERAEVDVACDAERPDYIAVGPVYETPTKPGRPAAGLDLLRYAAGRVDLPWFAIGGIDGSNLDDVLSTGARRIVVVRAITEAADPVAAASALRARLDQAPL